MILTREVIETEWNVIVQSAEPCTLGLITWISARSLGLITWKWQNRGGSCFHSSVTGGWWAASVVQLWKRQMCLSQATFSYYEWVNMSTASLPRCGCVQDHFTSLAIPVEGQWMGRCRERLQKGLYGLRPHLPRETKGLAGVIGKSNGQGRPDCNERKGNKQRGRRKLFKLKDYLGSRTNATCWPWKHLGSYKKIFNRRVVMTWNSLLKIRGRRKLNLGLKKRWRHGYMVQMLEVFSHPPVLKLWRGMWNEWLGRRWKVRVIALATQPDLPGCFTWKCNNDGHYPSAPGVSARSTFHIESSMILL